MGPLGVHHPFLRRSIVELDVFVFEHLGEHEPQARCKPANSAIDDDLFAFAITDCAGSERSELVWILEGSVVIPDIRCR